MNTYLIQLLNTLNNMGFDTEFDELNEGYIAYRTRYDAQWNISIWTRLDSINRFTVYVTNYRMETYQRYTVINCQYDDVIHIYKRFISMTKL